MGRLEETKAIKEHEGFIAWWARKFQRSLPWEIDDLKQEAGLAFLKAFRAYQPEVGPLTTFAGELIKHHFLDLILVEKRKNRGRFTRDKEVPSARLVSLDEPVLLDSDQGGRHRLHHEAIGAVDPSFERLERRQLHGVVKKQLERLSPRAKEMIERRCEGEGLEEVGARFGVGKERTRQIVKEAMAKTRTRVEAVIR